MHNFILKIRTSTANMIFAVLIIFSIIAVISFSYNYHRINTIYQEKLAINGNHTLYTINQFFAEINSSLEPFIGEAQKVSCDNLEYNLKQFVESQNLIRSITIIKNNKVYCSSFFEANQINTTILEHHIKNKLNLLESKFLKQQIPIITYSINQGKWSAYAAMPASKFTDKLLSNNLTKHSYIIFDDTWLNADNKILSHAPKLNNQWLILKSDQYPFKIAIDVSAIAWSEKTISSFIAIGAALLISLIAALVYIVKTKPKRAIFKALTNNEFIPYYQLIISAADQEWRGVEVLVRWQHPQRGLLTPNHFISSIEQSKLITPLTKSLMKKVASDLSPHTQHFPKPFYIAFNIHASHLECNDLIEDCNEFLASFPPNTVKLTLEMVEGEFITNSCHLDALLQEFRKIGVTIAMDDFGTGYSNLGYLQHYQIDHLKIDKSFVSKICNMASDTRLIDSIISLAKKMNMDVVAEGVENDEQFLHLTRQGVEFIQGFLFSRPSPLNEMITLLVSKTAKRIKSKNIYKLPIHKKAIKVI